MLKLSLRKLVFVLAAGAVAISSLLVGANAAQANGPSYRIAPYSNRFVYFDVSGGSTGDGAPIIQWSLSGDNQVFTLEPSGSHFQLVNRHSGKCITTDGVAGHQLYQWVCHGTSNQLWDTGLTPVNGYVYPIVSVLSGLYVDVEGGSIAQGAAIITWYPSGAANQYFLAYGA
jgi:hypothetical protein